MSALLGSFTRLSVLCVSCVCLWLVVCCLYVCVFFLFVVVCGFLLVVYLVLICWFALPVLALPGVGSWCGFFSVWFVGVLVLC